MAARSSLILGALLAAGCGHPQDERPLRQPDAAPSLVSPVPSRHFESTEGRFVVDFPCFASPYEHHSEVAPRLQSFECAPAEGVHFEVIYFDDPAVADVERTFARERAEAARDVVAVRRYRVQSFPAQTLEVEEPGKDWGGAFMTILAERRQYDVNVYGPGISPTDSRIRAFQQSFRILR